MAAEQPIIEDGSVNAAMPIMILGPEHLSNILFRSGGGSLPLLAPTRRGCLLAQRLPLFIGEHREALRHTLLSTAATERYRGRVLPFRHWKNDSIR